MKDSRKYSPKILKLFRSLKRGATRDEIPEYTDPVDAVVEVVPVHAEQLPQAGGGPGILLEFLQHELEVEGAFVPGDDAAVGRHALLRGLMNEVVVHQDVADESQADHHQDHLPTPDKSFPVGLQAIGTDAHGGLRPFPWHAGWASKPD